MADWVVVCLCAAPRVKLLVSAMDGHKMCHGIISSCQSAATSEIVKRFCTSLAHVISAIGNTLPLPLLIGCSLFSSQATL